uniref:GTP-binding protein 1-like n=1 Tax=Styela clava TaxID=7725 RepID=UPI00193961C3|nr:GTP-binding protein 1-like [Styela clava]
MATAVTETAMETKVDTGHREMEVNNLFAPQNDVFDIDDDDLSITLRKDVLVSPNDDEYDQLIRQLSQRIAENQGECVYAIGESEDDTESGLNSEELEHSKITLVSMAATNECDCTFLRERPASEGKVHEFLIRRQHDETDFLEVKVAVVGNVDAGKSTLLGVLTHNELDNGRGHARQKLFRHKHEAESGRTSSVGNEILGFDSGGAVVNKPDSHGGHIDWSMICRQSSKVITFVDLAGHERYLKTTVFGMTGHLPDFCMLMIGSNAGIVGMTKEHLGLALALNVPVFVVVTKIDMCPPNVLQETLKLLVKILKSPGCRKIPVLVSNKDDVIVTATNFTSERVCPIFQISNVTGLNLDLLKMFLNLLNCRTKFNEKEKPELLIDDTFSVPGVGTVVSGTVLQGLIRAGETLLLGPDALGKFEPIQIKSIHRKRMAVREVRAGQSAALALKKIKRANIRKGMVMVDLKSNPKAVWEFHGDILVLHHPTTISPKYQAMVHCGSIRQTATILRMNHDHLRTGDKASVSFRFLKNPEFLRVGQRFVFREGRTKAVGTINELVFDAPAYQSHLKASKNARQMALHRHFQLPSTSSTNRTTHSATGRTSPTVAEQQQQGYQKNPEQRMAGRRRGGKKQYDKRADDAEIVETVISESDVTK